MNTKKLQVLNLPQSDWNQNDESAAGYVKNRPFYTGDPVETLLVDNVEVTIGSGMSVLDPFQIEFIEGDNYIVTWNGTTYECTAYIASGPNTPSIGNGAIAGVSGGGDEPFFITAYQGNVLLFASEPGTYTVSITGMLSGVVKIPEKYMPKKYAGEIVNTRNSGGEVSYTYTSEVFNDYTNNEASGLAAHAEGASATASGDYSHAEGDNTTASGDYSHAEGDNTTASGNCSHAEGYGTRASGDYSHAEGLSTRATSDYQHVQGTYNILDENDLAGDYAHIVGNGNWENRSNAHTLDWDGNAWFAGDVYVGSTSGTNKDEGSVKLQKEIPVTTSDNGKFLRVVDGVWAAATVPNAEEASF